MSAPNVISVSAVAPSNGKAPNHFGRDGLGFDFALLGLRSSENQVGRIRRASMMTSVRIRELDSQSRQEQTRLLGELALSTYRLLDPRKRCRLGDRVQLSIFSEQDWDLQRLSQRSVFTVKNRAAKNPPPIPFTIRDRQKSESSRRRSAVAARAGTATVVTLAWILIGVAAAGLVAAGAF